MVSHNRLGRDPRPYDKHHPLKTQTPTYLCEEIRRGPKHDDRQEQDNAHEVILTLRLRIGGLFRFPA